MVHYIVQFTKSGAKLKAGLARQARELLRVGLWGVPTTAQLKMLPRPGDGILVAVGSPDRVFVGDAIVASGYHRFDEEEAARFPATLSYDGGLSLTQVNVWPSALPVMAAWPKTTASVSNPGALWFGAVTKLGSADAATITAARSQSGSTVPGESGFEANTRLGAPDRDEILALLDRGFSSSEIARRLEIPMMRVAAIKAHLTMGTYRRAPTNAAGPDTPAGGSESGPDLPSPSSALLGTRNRGRNPLSLDPEHREFEAKKEFGAACRDRRNQRRNKALLGDWCFS